MKDLVNGQAIKLALILGWQDVRQAYRRSSIGPFWITIGMTIQIVTMAIVFSMIFRIELQTYFPFLATNLILWGFFSSTINESSLSLITGEGIIRQIKLPISTHGLRVVWKNTVALAHNLVILPPVFIIFGGQLSINTLLAIPGFLLMVLNLSWISMLVGIACLRFRDLSPIVNSVVTIVYFITPIMWMPKLLGDDLVAHLLLGLNPVYHIFQVVRQPLLGELPTPENWIGSIALLGFGICLATLLHRKFKQQIAYWL